MRFHRSGVLVALGLGVGAAGADAGTSATGGDGNWRVRRWTTEQGLPHSRVMAIAQTTDGYLWLGTQFGLVRFDGVRFVTFDRQNTPGLPSDAVSSLAAAADGTLWVGTTDGLVEWRGGVARRYTRADGLTAKQVWQVLAAPDGGVWWRNDFNIGRIRAGKVEVFKVAHGLGTNTVHGIKRTPSGRLLAWSRHGAWRLDAAGERFERVAEWPQAGHHRDAAEDETGRLWMGDDQGLHRLEDGHWVSMGNCAGPDGEWIDKLRPEPGGAWWVGTSEGALFLWRAGRFTPVSLGKDIEWPAVSGFAEDREGHVWMGAGNHGLFQLRALPMKTIAPRGERGAREAWSVCPARDGGVWVGTGRGLGRIKDGQYVPLGVEEPDAHWAVRGVWEDSAGMVWFTKRGRTHYHGMCSFDGREFRVVTNELPTTNIGALYEDRSGRLWIGFDNGVTIHREGRFARLATAEGLFNANVRAVLEDRAGRFWIGTEGNGALLLERGPRTHPSGTLSRSKGERDDVRGQSAGVGSSFSEWRLTSFTTNNGLASNKAWALHEDDEGAIWIGGERGLARWKEGRMSAITTAHGLAECMVNHILEDGAGRFWLGGLKGIHCVRRAALDAVAEGRTNRAPCLSFSEPDGMTNPETNGEMQPAGCKTADGRLWFPTMGGVVVLDPNTVPVDDPLPAVVIEQVTADGEEVGIQNEGFKMKNLPPGRGRVMEIQYTANCLSAPEKVRFKWKLEPRDATWREAGTQRSVVLQQLKPGPYTFRLQACNHHGLWNEAGAALAFVIAPQFHEKWQFYAACAAGVVLLGLGVHVWRVRFLRHIDRLERAQAVQAERTRIARDLHDDVGAHLTALALHADRARREARDAGTAGQFQALAGIARAMVDEMRATVWALDPRHDSLESLAGFLAGEAQRQAESAGLRCRLDIAERLPSLKLSASVRHHLCLIVKEALHNAVKHAAASEIRLGVDVANGELRVTVADDGRGLDAAAAEGNGLLNMRARAAALGGGFALETSTGAGTRATFRVPKTAFDGSRP